MLHSMNDQKQSLAERGTQVYYQLKSKLEKKYDPSDVVFIEPDSGKYFVGKTTIETLKMARKQFPRKKFFVAYVGKLAASLK